MCDVPSIAVFCSESIECFPGTASKFFLKLLVTIPVAPIITARIVYFRFHIRCISIHKLLLLLLLFVGRGSVVGIATRYGLDGPGTNIRWGRYCPHPSPTTLVPTQPLIQWTPHEGSSGLEV